MPNQFTVMEKSKFYKLRDLNTGAAERFGNASLSYAPRRLVRQRLPYFLPSKLFKMPNQKREPFNACATCNLVCPFKSLSLELRSAICHVYVARKFQALGKARAYRPLIISECLN